MIKLNLKDFTNALKFCIVTAAKNDVRYYFNAVCLEVNADHIMVVGTDGHRISTVRLNVINDEALHGQSLLLDRPDVVQLLKVIDVKCPDDDTLALSADETTITIEHTGGSSKYTLVDGRFPDWRRAAGKILHGFRGKETPEPITEIGFDWGYLADIGKAFKHVQGGKAKPAKFEFNGAGTATKITSASVKSFSQLADPTVYLAPMRI